MSSPDGFRTLKVVASIGLARGRELRARILLDRGRPCVDLRLFGPSRPRMSIVATPKGVSLPIERLAELEGLVAKLRVAVEAHLAPPAPLTDGDESKPGKARERGRRSPSSKHASAGVVSRAKKGGPRESQSETAAVLDAVEGRCPPDRGEGQ